MRRKLAFVGFILATCFASILSLLLIIEWAVTIDLVNTAIITGYNTAGMGAVVSFMTIIVLMMITSLTLNAISISATTNATKMTKRKGLVITSVVFNFVNIALLLSIVGVAISQGIVETSLFYIIFMFGLIASNILILVDLGRLKKAYILEQTENAKKIEQTNVQPKVEEKQPQEQTAFNSKLDALEEEINKLIILKAKNLITEEEFEQLKRRAIEKSCNL